MIQRIRNSRTTKVVSAYLILNILVEIIAPMQSFALTGGDKQPEFDSFTPVGTSDMVDLSSGDMNYNIPLMDVGGYPINIAYSSDVSMDKEASWAGLGWDVSVGQINRNVRGLPDDFQGDEVTHENHLKPNLTVGANFKFTPGFCGVMGDLSTYENGNVSFGISVMYNNYAGFTVKPSVGMTVELSKNVSVGFNAENGPDGLALSPTMSLHGDKKSKKNKGLSANAGCSFNSRQGLTSATLNMSKKTQSRVLKTNSGKTYGEAGHSGGPSIGSAVSFAENSYTPSKRVGMVTGSFTVNAALGAELFGGEGQGQITAYGTEQRVADDEKLKTVKAYGYEHTEDANRYNAVDFNREKEVAMSVNATNLPVTNYTYDIYSVQGQGVSGMYRPYRNQVGYVFDTHVEDGSLSGSLGLEFGAGNAAHGGVDVEATSVYSASGLWDNQNNMYAILKQNSSSSIGYEKTHFKNVGDLSVDEEIDNVSSTVFNRVGRYQPVRVHYVGNKFHRSATNQYRQKYNAQGDESALSVSAPIKRSKRQSRNQSINNLTIVEAKQGIGYSPMGYSEYATSYAYTSAKGYHTGEVQVVRNDGARYIYGLPAYNKTKKETTFSVNEANGNCTTGLVAYNPGVDNSADNSINDEYFNRITTPAYAHSYLLTSVLSTDYVDKIGSTPGPDKEDLGSYTKFSYDLKNSNYKWRVPFEQNAASYNEGLKTNSKDDQGNYVYGEKEMYLIRKIETKTHVALFTVSTRHDAFGVLDENGGLNAANASYKLDKIELFSKAEYDANPSTAVPIKTANFEYDYSLCPNVPNNDNATEMVNGVNINANKGKLTLKKIYFTYRGSKMGRFTYYSFNYNNPNPVYNIKAYDTWGNYLPNTGTCLSNGTTVAPEFPYTEQDKDLQNGYASAWLLSSIDLPSGGTISVSYESDDYKYIQNKEALRMYKMSGVGSDPEPSGTGSFKNELYENTILKKPNKFMYLKLGKVSDPLVNVIDDGNAFEKLGKGIGDKIMFRCLTNMTQDGGVGTSLASTSKADYVTGYLKKGATGWKVFDIPVVGGVADRYLSIEMECVDRNTAKYSPIDNEVHPITMAAWFFGRKYLNKQVYSNLPDGEGTKIEDLAQQIVDPQIISNLLEVFMGPNSKLEQRLIGRLINPAKSWVRLKHTGNKLGGGCRVKEIRMSDVWEKMNGETPGTANGYVTMSYGQKYSYTQEGNTLSSGVASYEPIGNKENPFVQPVFSSEKHILAPDEENYIEMPFGESFFPNPQVTYARVSVENVTAGTNPIENKQVRKLHKSGKVVTEFYTTRDYPTIVDQTKLEAEEDKRDLLDNILKINVKKHFTASQGYVVHLNDMNGKQKAQRVFAEGQIAPISGVDYLYDNYSSASGYNASMYTENNKGTLNNTVKVIYPNGDVKMKTIGVEQDIVNDFMANESTTETMGINANLATFFVGIIPGIVPIPLPDYSHAEDKYRATSTTKVINTFGILKETIAFEDGSSVSTRNLAWDALTGEVLVTETVDEYSDKYYTFNFPAHWYYKGMGQASENLGLKGNLTNVVTSPVVSNAIGIQGVTSSHPMTDYMIAGDEIIYGPSNTRAWVSLVTNSYFKLINVSGTEVTISGNPTFKIVRSGHRNLQSAGIMNVTLMKNPLKDPSTNVDVTNLGTSFLNASVSWDQWRIINAGAVDYSDNWPAGCECDVQSLTGAYNPYKTNSKGVWRTKSSRTYLTGRVSQASTSPRFDGFLTTFSPMYKLTPARGWTKDMTNWTFVSEVSIFSPYGMELENKDAINRYSAAQYGYSSAFPKAVGANTRYRQIGFDGFEDYDFGCMTNSHFNFTSAITSTLKRDKTVSHTGKYSLIVPAGQRATMTKQLVCP